MRAKAKQSSPQKPPRKGPTKLPAFGSIGDAAKFFETHDAAPYLDQLEDAKQELRLSPKLRARILKRAKERLEKKLLTLRLERRQIEEARQIARQKGLGYLTLMRVWIQEGIDRARTGTR